MRYVNLVSIEKRLQSLLLIPGSALLLAIGLLLGSIYTPAVVFSAETAGMKKQAEIVWVSKNKGNFDLKYAFYDGKKWQGERTFSTGNPMNFVPASARQSNGDTWFVWSADSGVEYQLYYVVISDDNSIQEPRVIKTGMRSNTTPTIIVDAVDTLWIAWAGINDNNTNDDIFYSRYDGKQWEAPKAVHPVNNYPDIFPKLLLHTNGEVVVEWVEIVSLTQQRNRVVLQKGGEIGKRAQSHDVSSLVTIQKEISDCVPSVPDSIENRDMATIQLNCKKKPLSIQFMGKYLKKTQ